MATTKKEVKEKNRQKIAKKTVSEQQKQGNYKKKS